MKLTSCSFLLSWYLFCNHEQTEGINSDQTLKCKRATCQLHHCFLLELAEQPRPHIPGTWIISVVITLQYLIHHQPVNIEYNLIRKCESPVAGDERRGSAGPHVSLEIGTHWDTLAGLGPTGLSGKLTSPVHIPHTITSKPGSDTLNSIPYYTPPRMHCKGDISRLINQSLISNGY